MAKNLVIVESPAKAKTIKKYLGNSYTVMASAGHVRDLPKSRLAVDVEHGFTPDYMNIRGKADLINSLKKACKEADYVYLATDPDREGEAISWHLKEVLGLEEKHYSRITFNEITKTAVQASIKNARKLDMSLVDAQQARRVLDRLAGYQMSPVLWKKVKKGLSAGRVQSAALKLVCDRDAEIDAFIPEEFWTIDTVLDCAGTPVEASLSTISGQKAKITAEAEALRHKEKLLKIKNGKVSKVQKGSKTRKSPDPFITSTLQQEASKRLGMSSQKTMRLAQTLYEGVELKDKGTVALISYLRTDSVRISEEAREMAYQYIEKAYGAKYLPGSVTAKNKADVKVQDAHEAIRPTDVNILPKDIQEELGSDLYRLYKLIWERFVASQMAPAVFENVNAEITMDEYGLTANGSRLVFDGFLKLYKEEEDPNENFQNIEALAVGQDALIKKIDAKQHFTQPPYYFTEASLIRALQEFGIGRPSTYAPIVGTLVVRGYLKKEKKNLVSTELGRIVNTMISGYFTQVTDLHFTAGLEKQLDEVAEGNLNWRDCVASFYKDFEPEVKKAMAELEKVKLEYEEADILCNKCGRRMVIKMGKYGKFFACPGFPSCQNALPYFERTDISCPLCGARVQLRKSKAGKDYYCCERYPDCRFRSWDKPTEEKCPQCGERLYQKKGKKPMIVCLNESCGLKKPDASEECPF